MQEIAACLSRDEFVITDHARREMLHDGILLDDLIAACGSGEIIEDYPAAFPLPACLVLGWLPEGRPVHVCLSRPPWVKVITTYIPDPGKWHTDWKRRRRG
ncbi:MAG: DUF4258 domain-containing protein [Armatimonadetes bacterium]|nr:DUF4258 domain-containing protein [Armatimonadota bacterium]